MLRALDGAPSSAAARAPVVDGNKRTGLLAAIVFLDLNNGTIRDPDGRPYNAMIAVAERRLDKAGLASTAPGALGYRGGT
jgi:prophage maintenance system killer protein